MRNYLSFNIIFCFIVMSFTFLIFGCTSEQKHESKPEAIQKESVIIPVDTETACSDSIDRTLQVIGTFAADTTVNLAPQVGGKIRKVHARLGDNVKKGQLLLEIDPTDIELQIKLNRSNLQQQLAVLGMSSPDQPLPPKDSIPDVKKAKAKEENDLTTYNRKIEERKQDLISEQELDNARTTYMSSKAEYENQLFYADRNFAAIATSKAQLNISLQNLTYTKVYSPLDGFVQTQKVYDGDFISQGTPALVLVSSSPLLLNVDIPQKYSSLFTSGETMEVYTDAIAGKSFTGVIDHISPVTDPSSRTVKVQAKIENPSVNLKPGMFGKIDLIYAKDTVLLVPDEAVIEFKGLTKVFKIENNNGKYSAIEVGVHKGDSKDGWVEISGKIAPGDLVAVTSAASLDNGTVVELRKKGTARPPRTK